MELDHLPIFPTFGFIHADGMVKMITSASRLAISLAAAVIGLGILPAAEPGHAPGRKQIAAWVAQLGSSNFQEREHAAQKLRELDDARAELRAATLSQNAEIRRRAAAILDYHKRTCKQRAKNLIARLAKANELDRYIDAAVAWSDIVCSETKSDGLLSRRPGDRPYSNLNGDDFESSLCAIVDSLTTLAKKRSTSNENVNQVIGPDPKDLPRHAFPFFPASKPALGFVGDLRKSVVYAEQLKCGPMIDLCLVVANGPVDCSSGMIRSSYLLGNGNLACSTATDSVIFVCGDIQIPHIRNCLVICSGSAKLEFAPSNCIVIAGGEVTFDGQVRGKSLFSKDKEFFVQTMSLFVPKKMGVEVALSGNELRVTSLVTESPFGASGLRTGDRLLHIDGVEVKTIDHFTRMLRRRSVDFGSFAVRIRRGERELDLIVPWNPDIGGIDTKGK